MDGKLVVYELDRGAAGATLGVHNKFPTALVVSMDCSGSTNVMSHRGQLAADVRVASGACVAAHHIAPRDPESEWSWMFNLSARKAK